MTTKLPCERQAVMGCARKSRFMSSAAPILVNVCCRLMTDVQMHITSDAVTRGASKGLWPLVATPFKLFS
jgi:hypothetical protein